MLNQFVDIPDELANLDANYLRRQRTLLQSAQQARPTLSGQSVLSFCSYDYFDLALSSLAVQWIESPQAFIHRMSRVVKHGGYLALATLGPNTLWELRKAWSEVDNLKHVNEFHHCVDWLDAAWDSNFELVLWREEPIEVRYDSPLDLLRELKQLGANHVDRESRPKVTTLRRMVECYQNMASKDGRYPASWEVFYMILRLPN